MYRVKIKWARDRKIYERQPKETENAWACFVFYRDMGFTRRIRHVAKMYRDAYSLTSKLESTERTVQSWASNWRWKERIHEWDRMLDKRKRQAAIADVEQMKDRHIKLSNSLQVLGAQELQKWILKAKKDKSIRVTVADLLRAIDAGVRLERLSRGEPETVAEERHTKDSEMTREALARIIEDEQAMKALDVVLDVAKDESDGGSDSDDYAVN